MDGKKLRPRVLLGKPGLCGHDRGALILAMALRDAGMEVIYSGRHNLPEQLVEAAIQEDVDILGVSILSGAHISLCERIIAILEIKQAKDIVFVAGGFIPDEDMSVLKTMGVSEVFGVGSRIEDIVLYFQEVASKRREV